MKKRFALLITLLSISILVGCFDSEPKERAAFIKYLITDALPSNGFPLLSSHDAKKHFGIYAKDYALLEHYAKTIDKMDETLSEHLDQINKISSVSDLITVNTRDTIKKLGPLLETEKADFNQLITSLMQEKSQLSQPDDLKPYFDQVFEKFITTKQPTREAMYDAAFTVVNDFTAMADFLIAHPDTYSVSGSLFKFSNQDMLNEFNQRTQQLSLSREKLSNLIQQWNKIHH